MVDYLSAQKDFNLLSLKDLLEASSLFHIHLAHKQNVIGTAIGRYLIRKSDPWPKGPASQKPAVKRKEPRTLANSEVRPYSWPCLLVFVRQWEDEAQFGRRKGLAITDAVPRALYMPDGRVVPVCVVLAPLQETVSGAVETPLFASSRIGGGYPLIVEAQKQEHVASIGCLVTDGHLTYALTSRHVSGPPGTVIKTRIRGVDTPIGKSSGKQLSRLPFEEVYNGWPGKEVYVNLDAGLVEIDDLTNWTAQIHRIGQIGKLADLSVDNLSLKLIGCPVRAYGAVSRDLRGQIHGLFYRYKSVGGFEHIADFLIGPRPEEEFTTHPGDSGTVWLIETENNDDGPLPFALQWGGHVFLSDGATSQAPYALASTLSTICLRLDVDVIRDWNLGLYLYWGEMGHYTIGAKACEILKGDLRTLMMNNQTNIGFRDDQLKDPDKYRQGVAHYKVVPLSDVADDVWRDTRKSDANNHFADMDQPADSGPYAGKTLMDLFEADPGSVDPKVWLDFYAGVSEKINPGALPFRVWQIFDEMVRFLNEPGGPNIPSFVCAAGCLAHYVGDACQPLHVSRLHHGHPPIKKGTVAYEVHAAYETDLLNLKAPEIVEGLNQRLQALRANGGASLKDDIRNGREAAERVVQLMKKTFAHIPPADLVDTYNKGTSPANRLERLWGAFGEKTMDSMAAGCQCLAEIWQSAWNLGPTKLLAKVELSALDPKVLSDLYGPKEFLPSVGLKAMVELLTA